MPCQRFRARNAPIASSAVEHVDDAGLDDVDRTAAIRPITPAATPRRNGPEAVVLGDRDELAVEEDREDEGGDEDAERHRQRARQAAGDVADEGREDDQRGGEDAADREAVDELALGQPVLAADRDVVEDTGSP